MEQTENLGGYVPPVPPWFLRLCYAMTMHNIVAKWENNEPFFLFGFEPFKLHYYKPVLKIV